MGFKMLKRPLQDKENLPLRDRGHPKWKKYYGLGYRISRKHLYYMRRLIGQYINQPWNKCLPAILQNMKDNKLSEFATIKFVTDNFIILNPLIETATNRETGLVVEIFKDPETGATIGDDCFYVDKNGNIQKCTSQYDIFKEDTKQYHEKLIALHNGFIKDNYWFKKICGIWYVADVVTQRLVDKTILVKNPTTDEETKLTYQDIKYGHVYGQTANHYYGSSYGYHSGFQYNLNKQERKIWNEINYRREKAGLKNIGYSYYGYGNTMSGTYIPGNKVAICKKVCNKQILKKYGLVNDTPAEQERLRNLMKRGKYVCG